MNQRGFTLVEISIVLVIIGLLLGGILGGQSLIRSARAKDNIAIIEDLRTATTYFKNRYNYLPGDLPAPASLIVAVPALVAGSGGTIGDGTLDGVVTAATGKAAVGSEVAQAPWQLYQAGMLGKIDRLDPGAYVSTTFGPVQMVSLATANTLIPGYAAANPAVRNVILFFNLSCDVAIDIDGKVDDSSLATGRGMGTACAGTVVQFYAIPL